jgi:hypothetical protein
MSIAHGEVMALTNPFQHMILKFLTNTKEYISESQQLKHK